MRLVRSYAEWKEAMEATLNQLRAVECRLNNAGAKKVR